MSEQQKKAIKMAGELANMLQEFKDNFSADHYQSYVVAVCLRDAINALELIADK